MNSDQHNSNSNNEIKVVGFPTSSTAQAGTSTENIGDNSNADAGLNKPPIPTPRLHKLTLRAQSPNSPYHIQIQRSHRLDAISDETISPATALLIGEPNLITAETLTANTNVDYLDESQKSRSVNTLRQICSKAIKEMKDKSTDSEISDNCAKHTSCDSCSSENNSDTDTVDAAANSLTKIRLTRLASTELEHFGAVGGDVLSDQHLPRLSADHFKRDINENEISESAGEFSASDRNTDKNEELRSQEIDPNTEEPDAVPPKHSPKRSASLDLTALSKIKQEEEEEENENISLPPISEMVNIKIIIIYMNNIYCLFFYTELMVT